MEHVPKWAVLCSGVFITLLATLSVSLSGGRAQMSMASVETARLPVVMYHHILADAALLGDYVISPQQFERDLCYIKDSGYESVLPREVAAFVAGEGSLPEKPIMITFDDGNKSTFVYALPLLKKYGMKATLAVIGSASEEDNDTNDNNVAYAHVNWQDVMELESSGLVEVANHTYNLHEAMLPRAGIRRTDGEPLEKYKSAVYDDIRHTQELLCKATGRLPSTFAYPYGFIDSDADEVLDALGFTVTLGVWERVNTVTRGDRESAKKLGRYNRPSFVTSKTFFAKILPEN